MAALRTLSRQVNSYVSLREFEEDGRVARLPFARFFADFSAALEEIDRVLAQLPRGPLCRALRNARNAFREGASWWSKSSRAELRTVSASSTPAPDPLKLLGLQPDAVNYTIVCDWRRTTRAVEEAEGIIRRLRDGGVDATSDRAPGGAT